MIRAGIVGANGYAGGELMRLLLQHPGVQLAFVGSRSRAGQKVSDVMPGMPPWIDLTFEAPTPEEVAARCDVIFTATPRGTGMPYGEAAVAAGKRLIDIGTDFRFRDPKTYEKWYGVEHTCPNLSVQAAYGLPELFRNNIIGKQVVGNPGCYPTSILLALAPLVVHDIIETDRVAVSSYSGYSGAGINATELSHLPHGEENLLPYAATGHRHTPEIEQGMALLHPDGPGAVTPVVSFTPHLVPMSRGILSTVKTYPKQPTDAAALQRLYDDYYADERFVHVASADKLPQTKHVRGTNMAQIAVRYDERSRTITSMAAIDNLVKGAAGQAVQNMNILFDVPEMTALDAPGMYP